MMRWKDRLKGGQADCLRPQDFPKRALMTGMRHELEHTKSHRLAMEIAMDHLAEDPKYYEKLAKMERQHNPSVSRRQQRFMCAEYGRATRGQRTRTSMKRATLKEFCMARRKNAPNGKWYAFATMNATGTVKHFQTKQFMIGNPKHARGLMDVRGPFATEEKALVAKEKLKKAEMKWQQSKEYAKRKKKYGLKSYSINPHLTSGKWRFVGMFEKRDIPSVRRILKIHGMKNKVTKDHLKREPGMRELYVERGGYDTAYRAITRLFEGGRAA